MDCEGLILSVGLFSLNHDLELRSSSFTFDKA